MLDNRLIDVAIGLVLVFALSGLAVSVLHEAWISMPWKRSRGNVLLKAIGSMLGDNGGSAGSLMLALGSGPRLSTFTMDLMKQPLLQSQVLGPSRPEKNKGPSYLQPEVFVSALLAFLTQRYISGERPATPREWVNAVAAGAPHARASAPNDVFVQALQSLADGAADDWPTYEKRLCAWYEAVMERAQGWFQRDTQARLFWVGFLLAVVLNLNAITMVQRLWSDAPMRAAFVSAAQQAGKAYEAASAPAGTASAVEAAASAALASLTAQGVLSVPAGLPATVVPRSFQADQAVKRYKEALFRTAEVRGHHPLGPKTVAVEDAIEQLLDLEEQIVLRRKSREIGPYPQATFEFSEQIELRLAAMKNQIPDARHASAQLLLDELDEALRAERQALLPARVGQLRPLGACGAIADERAKALCNSVNDINDLAASSLPIGWSWANWPGCDAECRERHASSYRTSLADEYARMAATPSASASAVHAAYRNAQKAPEQAGWNDEALRDPWGWIIALLGWAIVGVASMLGAPFWFDLLGKLVKLRGSGTKVDGQNAGSSATDGGGGGSVGSDAAPRTVLSPPPAPPAPAPTTDAVPMGATVPARTLTPAAEPVPVAPRMADAPRRADGTITVLTEHEVRALYGDFRTIPDPAKPGHVQFASDQEAAKRPLVRLQHAALARVLPTGIDVHGRAAQHFQKVFDQIVRLGLQSDIVDCGGTISMRHIMRNPAKPLSRHCWGIAIDINTQANGYGVTPPTSGTGSLMRLVPIFEAHGFAWGGRFSSGVDGMHFELALRQP